MVSNTPSNALGGSFNLVSNFKFDKEPPLADFNQVVTAINVQNRGGLLTQDIRDHVESYTPSPEIDRAFRILEGQHEQGFSLAIVAAAHGGKKVFMPVIGDEVTGRTLVLGPAELAGAKPDSNTEYVSAADPDAVLKINNFMVSGARQRGENHTMGVRDARALVEDMIHTSTMIADLGKETVPQQYTVGDAMLRIASGTGEVFVYSAAAKPASKKLTL